MRLLVFVWATENPPKTSEICSKLILKRETRQKSRIFPGIPGKMGTGGCPAVWGSYVRLADFVYHATLGLRVIKKKKRSGAVYPHGLRGGSRRQMLLITEFIKEDSPFCLTRAITRTMVGPCYTPLSLAPRGAPRS